MELPLGRIGTAVFGLIMVLSLAACATSEAARGGVSVAPARGPAVGPDFVTATWNPVDPRLQYINVPAQVNLGPHGDFIVADVGTFDRKDSKVVEITPTGHVVWALYGPGLDFVHSGYLTSQGTILVADTNHNRVIEVDRDGRIVWNSDDQGGGDGYYGRGRLSDGSQLLYPNDAKELPNGHFLISSRLNSTVFEINRDGHVYWKCHSFINLQGKPDHLLRQHNPHRLPNGDTLIADSDNARIVEVDKTCSHEVWEYGGTDAQGRENLIWPRDANIVNNFNNNGLTGHHYGQSGLNLTEGVLIDDSKHDRLIEVTHDSKKRLIQEWDHLDEPYSETLLGNDTFVVGAGFVHGIDIFNLAGNLVGVVATRPWSTLPTRIEDPGFEPSGDPLWTADDLLAESLPPGERAEMYFDPTEKHSGYSSARITWKGGGQLGLWWGQAVSVKPDHRYAFSGWIKTDNVGPCKDCNFGKGTVDGSTAYFDLVFLQPGPYKPPPDVLTPLYSGTQGWTQVLATFDVPDDTVGMAIEGRLDGEGTAWFDDVSLKDLGAYDRRNPG